MHIAAVFIVLGTSAAGVGVPLVTGWIRGRDGRKASEGDSAAFGRGVGWVRSGFFLARHFGTVRLFHLRGKIWVRGGRGVGVRW
jgi:zinc transporter 1/2/3